MIEELLRGPCIRGLVQYQTSNHALSTFPTFNQTTLFEAHDHLWLKHAGPSGVTQPGLL